MDAFDQRADLDISFRRNVLHNVIIKQLNEWGQNSQDPDILHKINDLSNKFEAKVFEKAKSKDDYVMKIQQKLMQAKNKIIDVLVAPSTGKGSTTLSSLSEAETISLAQWQLSMVQFRHTRSTYLPELIELRKKADDQCAQAQNIEELKTVRNMRILIEKMIKFLNISENEMRCYPQEKLCSYLNKITQYIHSVRRRNTPLLDSTLIRKPMIPSSSLEPGFPCYQSSAPNSLLRNNRINLEQNTKLIESSSKNQAPLDMLLSRKTRDIPGTKDDLMGSVNAPWWLTVSEFPENAHNSLPHPSNVLIDHENNTSINLNRGTFSQPKASTVTVDSRAKHSPLIVSSTKNGNSKPSCEEASRIQGETEETYQSIALGESNQIPNSTKRPIERLIEVVQSMSREALVSSLDDIFSAISTMDRLPEYANGDECKLTLDEDFVNFASCSSQAMDSDGHKPDKKLKRDISSMSRYASMTLDTDNSTKLSGFRSNSAPMSSKKRPRIEPNRELMDEITKINRRLIETVIEVDYDSINNNIARAPEAKNNTIVRCTYKLAVALSEDFKRHLLSSTMLSTFSVEFLVPSDYPTSPPEILDRLPGKGSSKETNDPLEKARSIFNRCVRGLRQPISLGDMARAWDESVRSVFYDFALSVGGESFSSKYGTWECVPATQ